MAGSISGLASGLDTATIVSQLMQLEAIPQERIKLRVGAEQRELGETLLQSLLIEKVNGEPVLAPTPDAEQAQVHAALADAGFSRTPRGLRLR